MAPKAVKLADHLVHLRPDGTADVLGSRGGRHPDVEGRLVGEALMSKPAPHGGERHIDGDELLYLISGVVRVSLDHDDREPEVVTLGPGDAFVVPQGTWHRVLVDEPSDLLFMTPGRNEVRPQR
jgi:mannose-6-phosphate isomerase-like protein (cupin superfamily)